MTNIFLLYVNKLLMTAKIRKPRDKLLLFLIDYKRNKIKELDTKRQVKLINILDEINQDEGTTYTIKNFTEILEEYKDIVNDDGILQAGASTENVETVANIDIDKAEIVAKYVVANQLNNITQEKQEKLNQIIDTVRKVGSDGLYQAKMLQEYEDQGVCKNLTKTTLECLSTVNNICKYINRIVENNDKLSPSLLESFGTVIEAVNSIHASTKADILLDKHTINLIQNNHTIQDNSSIASSLTQAILSDRKK